MTNGERQATTFDTRITHVQTGAGHGIKMASIRTFIAVDIPPAVRAAAERQMEGLRRAGADFRWVNPQNFHLTLRFLGNIRDTEIPELCRVVTHAVQELEPVSLGVRGLGAFPNLHQPKVVWMGCGPDLTGIQQLHAEVSRGLQAMGFPLEKGDFRPHLTLGRMSGTKRLDSDVAALIESRREMEFGEIDIDQIVVYSSFIDRHGSTHTPMATIDLNG